MSTGSATATNRLAAGRHERLANIHPGRQDGTDVERFIDTLSEEERLLIVLKKELYECRWDEMIADLRGRMNGRPYVYKLIHRIEDDLERIEKLRDFERRRGVDLSDYVRMEP